MSGEQDRIDIAQAAAQQLRETGINCTVEIPAQMDWGGQMACLIGWGSPFDADDHTYKVFGTDKGANYSSYSNEKVDEYLSLARQSGRSGSAERILRKIPGRTGRRSAYAFICYIDANYVADSEIQAFPKIRYWGTTALVFSGIFRTGQSKNKNKKQTKEVWLPPFLSVQEKTE